MQKKASWYDRDMNILQVIPISKAISKETLTYFSGLTILPGSIVEIPIRNKKTHGIVISSVSVSEKKGEIKNLSYNIKKIESIKSKSFLSPSFIESAHRIADYYASSTGAVLSLLIPKVCIESLELLAHPQELVEKKQHHIHVLQASDEERYAMYKSYIREEFAHKGSVFFILPTIEDIKTAKQTLEKGIEQYTYTFHGEMTKKEIIQNWNAVIFSPHPVLILSTGSFLCIPRHDIGTIVLENESSRAYSLQNRPYLDIRTCAEIIAKTSGITLVLGDLALRVETIWKQKNDIYSELGTLKFRSLSTSEGALIDARKPKNSTHKTFDIFTPALKEMIRQNKEHNEHLFLFCGRKGLAPLSVCRDCGQTVLCLECAAPVTTYAKKGSDGKPANIFVCHKCGSKRSAHETCSRCTSWNLQTLGIGIETVEKELQTLFPDVTIWAMDRSIVKTHKQAVALIEKFYDHPGSILLGTEMALTYLTKKIGGCAVVSLDALFSVPDFRINEKIMRIILSLRNLAHTGVIVQTRQPNQSVFEYALKGNLSDFYREEIAIRKSLGYPPFSTFIKISREGNRAEIRKAMEELKTYCKPHDMSLFESFHKGPQHMHIVNGLIVLPRGEWIDKPLLQKLRSLSPEYQIKIDPDSLL
jgi:primosomal protein N' (replication factor Y)